MLWTAAIGWRRFQQGILIRYGQTRRVGYGTIVRLLSSGGTALGLLAWGRLPGVTVGGCALMAGVLSEAVFVTYLARPTIRLHLSGPDPENKPPLSLGKIARFHAPLAATSLLTLLAQPFIGAGLARMVEPDRSLAAWPVVYYVANIVRSIGYSLPEVVIALLDDKSSLASLRRFCLAAATASLLILGLVAFTR